MNNEQDKIKPGNSKKDESPELTTEGPISEKDEVKAAERKTAQLNKKDKGDGPKGDKSN